MRGGVGLRRARAAAQALGADVAMRPDALVSHLLAVQAQDLRGARLALRARSRGLVAADVDRALSEERTVVVAWLLRGTLHLVAAEDHGWLLSLTAPTRWAASRRRLGQLGVSPDDAERAVDVIAEALTENGPLVRAALADRLAERGIPTEGQATPHLLGLAALRGVTVLGPVREDGHAFALASDWLPAARKVPRDAALAELARRYLTAHGPATAADLAAWAGLPLRDARAALRAIGAELVEAGELVDLARRSTPPGRIAPRLLPAFDPYLLGWKDRSFCVTPLHARRVQPGGGMLRAVATVDGRAVATWGVTRGRNGLTVTLDPFARLPAADRRALETEAADVARFEGRAPAPLAVVARDR